MEFVLCAFSNFVPIIVAMSILCWSSTCSSTDFLRMLFMLNCTLSRLFVLFIYCPVMSVLCCSRLIPVTV